ncbi:MAG: class B sortase [Eubacterium sp.]|nr:class B sortase [Eubacterium sp.]
MKSDENMNKNENANDEAYQEYYDKYYNEDKKKKNAKLIIIFLIVFVLIFCGVYFGIQIYNNHINETPTDTTVPTTVSEVQQKVENPIDFASLQAANSEIYAYIKIEDTNVDYPIVQSATDDEFYLRHTAEDKSWSASGAVYTESVNTKTFNDRVTVIYGHNGYGDTFFTTLHRFEKEDFFNNHPYFYIYTPEKKLTYQVISAFKYDDRHIMNSFNFADTVQFLEFEQYLSNPSSALKNVRTQLDKELDEDSKIVVLSTCITNQKSSRYLVCGVLVKDEQTY